MEAPPGQPVCKHSSTVCFGRAPAPQCHSKLQQGHLAVPPEQGHHSPAVHPFPPGLGRAGEGGLQSTLSSILGHTMFGTHGFSRLLGSPLGGGLGREARGVPEGATWPGISLAEVPFKLGLGVGQPLPAGQLWSRRLVPLVSSDCSCSRVAGLSFRKEPAGGQLCQASW